MTCSLLPESTERAIEKMATNDLAKFVRDATVEYRKGGFRDVPVSGDGPGEPRMSVQQFQLPNGAWAARHPHGHYGLPGQISCGTFWGSHSCDLTAGHPGQHLCGATDPDGPCSTETHFLNKDGTLRNPHSMRTYTR